MRYVRCDGIEKDWSVVTLGCWQIGPSDGWGNACSPAEADSAVKTALDCGITAFDTAEGYGDGESERRLGKGLGARKHDAIVVSKIWPDAELSLAGYQERLNASLKALGRDYVDVYLVHWPGNYFNSRDKSAKLCEIMSALKQSGKTRVAGLSNFRARDLALLGEGIARFATNQVPYNLLDREYEGETRDLCRKSRIKYMVYSPTAVGLLARDLSGEDRIPPARADHELFREPLFSQALKVFGKVKEVAGEIQVPPVQAALAWVLAQGNILSAVVGSRKAAQVREFAKAGDLRLGREPLDRLTAASDEFLAIKARS